MNILEIVNKACIRCKMPSIGDLFSSDNQAREFLGYAETAAYDILNYHTWRKLITTKNFVSTATDTFVLPADFNGLSSYYIYDIDRNLMLPYTTDDKALEAQSNKTNIDEMPWRVIGSNIVFNLPIDAGRNLRYTYKSKFFALSDTSVIKETFTQNTDTFVLDTEALIRGICYQKALSYADADLSARENAFRSHLFSLRENEAALRKSNVFEEEPNRISPVEFQPYGGNV